MLHVLMTQYKFSFSRLETWWTFVRYYFMLISTSFFRTTSVYQQSVFQRLKQRILKGCVWQWPVFPFVAMPTVEGHSYGLPPAQGLYDPRHESDACGVGFVVSIDGVASHKVRFTLIYDNSSSCNVKGFKPKLQPPRYSSGRVLASSAGDPGFNPHSRIL